MVMSSAYVVTWMSRGGVGRSYSTLFNLSITPPMHHSCNENRKFAFTNAYPICLLKIFKLLASTTS